MLSFHGQLLQLVNVASLSRPTVFLQCYSLLLLYFGQNKMTINDEYAAIRVESDINEIK